MRIPSRDSDTPIRKALKMESLSPVAVKELEHCDDGRARCVDASMQSFDAGLFSQNIWYGETGESMRLPVRLRDGTGCVDATLWASEFENVINKNIDELGTLYGACAEGDEPRKAFLAALNVKVDVRMRWVLRPKPWTKPRVLMPVKVM